jgi:hypothetical protein
VPMRRIRWRRSLGPSEGCVGDRVSCIQWCARGALEAEARLQIRHPSEEQSGVCYRVPGLTQSTRAPCLPQPPHHSHRVRFLAGHAQGSIGTAPSVPALPERSTHG